MNNDLLEYLRKKYANEKPNLFDVGISQSTATLPAVAPPPRPPEYTPNLTLADIEKSSVPGLEAPPTTPEIFEGDPFSKKSPAIDAAIPPIAPPADPEPPRAPEPVSPAPMPKMAENAQPDANLPPSVPVPAAAANGTADPLAGFSAADRAKLENETATSPRELIGEALAGLGDAVSRSYGGNKGANHLGQTIATVKAGEDRALANFDKRAALAKENYDAARQIIANNRADVDRSEMTDPNSPISKAQQSLLNKIDPGKNHSKINALQAEILIKPILERYKIDETSQAKRESAKDKAAETNGQKFVDKEFAKDYADFVLGGGYADVQKNLSSLRSVVSALQGKGTAEKPRGVNATGIVGLIPKGVRDVVAPQGAALQDRVEEVVQRNLRLVLGAQFTQKEGENLIARAYNPRQSESENISRLNRLIKQIDEAARSKAEAGAYYEKHGTLAGFSGRLYRSPEDFLTESKSQPSASGGANEVRRRAADGRVIVYDATTKQPLREEKAQ